MRAHCWRVATLLCGLSLLTGACLAQNAPAQDTKQPSRKHYASAGVWELGGTLAFQRVTAVADGSTGNAVYTLSAYPYVGWFITQGLELGANPIGATMVIEEDTTDLDLLTLGSIAYVYRTGSMWYPFVEGFAGYAMQVRSVGGRNTTRDGLAWGGRVGVKAAIVERALLTVGAQYLQITRNPAGADERNGTNELSFLAGFTIWF